MGPIYYVMAIMGCGEADAPCEQVAVLETRYESVQACQAQAEEALELNSDVLYPVVVAECQQEGLRIASKLTADQVKRPQGEQPRFAALGAPVTNPRAR